MSFWSRKWSGRRAWRNSGTGFHTSKCRLWKFGPFLRKIKCLAATNPGKLGSVVWASERGQYHSSLRNVVKNFAEVSFEPPNCARFLFILLAATLPTEQNAPTGDRCSALQTHTYHVSRNTQVTDTCSVMYRFSGFPVKRQMKGFSNFE